MKHNYHERRANRVKRAAAQAAKNEKATEQLHKQADDIASHIPPGQPILVGHHSEKRHRRDLDNIHNKMSRARDAADKAAYYADKAESIEKNTAIASDNPDAIDLLEQKLAKLTTLQDFMKAANKAIRKNDREAFMKIPSATADMWEKLITPDFMGRIGYPDYKLRNNNQVMAATRKRLEALRQQETRGTSTQEIKGVRLVENTGAGRVQLVFSAKPSETVRKALRRAGFRWSPTEGAWQRHLNGNGLFAAHQFLESYEPSDG